MPLIPQSKKESEPIRKKRGPLPICNCETCEVCKARIRQQNFYRRKKLGQYDTDPTIDINQVLGNRNEI